MNTVTMNSSLRLYLLWVFANLFFFYQFILRLFAGILKCDIMSKFNMTDENFGSLVGYYYLGYALMQIPFGIMLEKLSFRLVTACSIFTASAGTLLFSSGETWIDLVMGRFLMGAGSGVAFLACAKIIQNIFDPKYHSIMFGLTFTFGLIGAVFGVEPMRYVFDQAGYAATMQYLVFTGFFLALMVLILGKIETEQTTKKESIGKIFGNIMDLIFTPGILIVSICGGLMVGALEGFADVWAMPFFSQIHNMSQSQSNIATSCIYFGMCCGGPILVMIASIIKSEEMMIILSGIISCLIFITMFLLTNISFLAAAALMFLLGIVCCYQVLIFSVVSKIGSNFSSLAIAIANSINMSFGHFFHVTLSTLIQTNWDGTTDNIGLPLYSREGMTSSLIIVPTLCFIAQFGFIYMIYKTKKTDSKTFQLQENKII